MRRLLAACAASLLLYGVLFACVLDRPLSHGVLHAQIEAKLARAAMQPSPMLVILAGSNGPYSHRCEAIEALIGMPCVNGGVAVGISLDYLFARWSTVLRPGDVLYLPMEIDQYTRTRAAAALGPDAAIMVRHDHATLAGLPPDRWLAAFFAFDLRHAVMALVESLTVAAGYRAPFDAIGATTNAWGDRIGHTAALAEPSRAFVAAARPSVPGADAIHRGFGASRLGAHTAELTRRGVRVVGGLPTGVADAPLPDATVAALRAVYEANGGEFLELENRSRYPRALFFDTADHLQESAQIAHSAAIAGRLAGLLDRQRTAEAGSPAPERPGL